LIAALQAVLDGPPRPERLDIDATGIDFIDPPGFATFAPDT